MLMFPHALCRVPLQGFTPTTLHPWDKGWVLDSSTDSWHDTNAMFKLSSISLLFPENLARLELCQPKRMERAFLSNTEPNDIQCSFHPFQQSAMLADVDLLLVFLCTRSCSSKMILFKDFPDEGNLWIQGSSQ